MDFCNAKYPDRYRESFAKRLLLQMLRCPPALGKGAVSIQLPPHSLSSACVSAYIGGEEILQTYLAQTKIIAFKKKRQMCLQNVRELYFYSNNTNVINLF